MKLSQATSYFNLMPLEGWVSGAWQPLFISCNYLSYDRFVGPRTFGHRQRVLLCGPENQIPAGIEYVRTPEPKPYLILSLNTDIKAGEPYGYSYIVQVVPYTAQLISFTDVPAPSGLGGTLTEVLGPQVFCDLERYSSEGSSELDAVRYPAYSILVPSSTVVDTDDEVEIDGVRYEIREINPKLDATELRCAKRGTA